MKKFIAMMLCIILVLSLVACGNNTEETTEPTTEPTTETTTAATEEITEEITEEATEDIQSGDMAAANNEFLDTGFMFYGLDADGAFVDVEPFEEGIFLRDLYRDYPSDLPGGLLVREVGIDEFEYQVAIPYEEGMKAYVSESMMGAGGHCAVLLIVPEGMDVEAVRANIEANANPQKSISHTAEKVAVVAEGNTIFFVMSFEPVVDHMVAKFQENMAG